jgi:hypothetical protein
VGSGNKPSRICSSPPYKIYEKLVKHQANLGAASQLVQLLREVITFLTYRSFRTLLAWKPILSPDPFQPQR